MMGGTREYFCPEQMDLLVKLPAVGGEEAQRVFDEERMLTPATSDLYQVAMTMFEAHARFLPNVRALRDAKSSPQEPAFVCAARTPDSELAKLSPEQAEGWLAEKKIEPQLEKGVLIAEGIGGFRLIELARVSSPKNLMKLLALKNITRAKKLQMSICRNTSTRADAIIHARVGQAFAVCLAPEVGRRYSTASEVLKDGLGAGTRATSGAKSKDMVGIKPWGLGSDELVVWLEEELQIVSPRSNSTSLLDALRGLSGVALLSLCEETDQSPWVELSGKELRKLGVKIVIGKKLNRLLHAHGMGFYHFLLFQSGDSPSRSMDPARLVKLGNSSVFGQQTYKESSNHADTIVDATLGGLTRRLVEFGDTQGALASCAEWIGVASSESRPSAVSVYCKLWKDLGGESCDLSKSARGHWHDDMLSGEGVLLRLATSLASGGAAARLEQIDLSEQHNLEGGVLEILLGACALPKLRMLTLVKCSGAGGTCGTIPAAIGGCESLVALDLNGSEFEGAY